MGRGTWDEGRNEPPGRDYRCEREPRFHSPREGDGGLDLCSSGQGFLVASFFPSFPSLGSREARKVDSIVNGDGRTGLALPWLAGSEEVRGVYFVHNRGYLASQILPLLVNQ